MKLIEMPIHSSNLTERDASYSKRKNLAYELGTVLGCGQRLILAMQHIVEWKDFVLEDGHYDKVEGKDIVARFADLDVYLEHALEAEDIKRIQSKVGECIEIELARLLRSKEQEQQALFSTLEHAWEGAGKDETSSEAELDGTESEKSNV